MTKKDIINYAKKGPSEISNYLQVYLERLKARPANNNQEGTISETTIYEHLCSIRPILEKYYDIKGLEKSKKKLLLEEIDIDFIINHFINTQRRREKYNRYFLFLEYNKERGLVTKEYCESFKKRINQYINFKKKIIDPEKIKKWSIPEKRWNEVYKKANTNPLRFACWLGFNFGLRVGELCHLKLENIILGKSDQYIIITPDLESGWNPKTINSQRQIPIAESHIPVIKRYLKSREEFLMPFLEKKNKSMHYYLLYSTWNGDPIVEDTLRDWFGIIGMEFEEKGKTFLRYMRPHVCRYSFSVNFYYKTLNIHRLSSLLGHSSIRETERYLALTKDQAYKESKLLMREVYDRKEEKVKIEELYSKLEREISKVELIANDKDNKYRTLLEEIINEMQLVKRGLLKL